LREGAVPSVGLPQRIRKEPGASTRKYDVVFVGDLLSVDDRAQEMLEEVYALRKGNYRIGVMNLESGSFMHHSMETPLNSSIQELINIGVIEEVFFDDAVSVKLLALQDPSILQFVKGKQSNISPKEIVILANKAPSNSDGSHVQYLVEDCHRNATAAFGREPIWVPMDPQIRRILECYLPERFLADFDFPGIIDIESWWHERIWYRSTFPVVGRYSCDTALSWPSQREIIEAAYPVDGRFDVRILGETKTAIDLLK